MSVVDSRQFRQITVAMLAVWLMLGVLARFVAIGENNFFYYDEGYYLNFSLNILQLIDVHEFSSIAEFGQAFKVYLHRCLGTGKALWFFVVDSRAFFGSVEWWSLPRLISAISGSLTIGVTYLFASRYYNSKPIGFLSCVLLAVLPGHVFYSRLGIQEALSTLFFILGFYFYLFPRKFGFRTFISSLFFVCVFFTNYRQIVAPAIVLAVELFVSFASGRKPDIRKYVWHTLIFFLLIFGIGSIGEGTNTVTTFSWMFYQVNEAKGDFHLLNFLSFPYYIFRLENFILGLFFFGNVYFVKKGQWSNLLPFFIVCVLMAIFSLPGEKGARYLAVGLPFLVMAVASLVVNLLTALRKDQHQYALIICVFVMVAGLYVKSHNIANAKPAYQQSIIDIQQRDPRAKIISSQKWIHALFVGDRNNVEEVPHTFKKLMELYAKGYRYLILDPQAYVTYSKDKKRFGTELEDYLEFVTDKVYPTLVYPHFNDVILERFVFEHNEDLLRSINFLEQNDMPYGTLRVYDLNHFIPLIMKQLSQKQIEQLK